MTTKVMAVDASGRGLGLISLERAINLVVRRLGHVTRWFDNRVIWMGPLDVLTAVFPEDVHDGIIVREAIAVLKAPAVIQVMTFLKMGRRMTPSPTTRNVITRDDYRCQNMACGKSYRHDVSKLSKDHVMPLSRGGKNVWENVTTLCGKCNNKKSDRTLEEMGWKLFRKPKAPGNYLELQLARIKSVPEEWRALLKIE